MAEITVSLGVKQNPGNFEQVSQFVSVRTETAEVGDNPTDKEISEQVDRLYNIVETKLVEVAKDNYEVMTGQAKRKTKIRPQ